MKKAAVYITEHRHKIIDSWEEAVNKEIKASSATETLLLRNILPNLLEDIAAVMLRHEGSILDLKEEECQEIIDKSIDHGRHRATSSHYDVKQMIREYIVLNRTLTYLLVSEGLHDADTSVMITYTLETSMSFSINSFTDSLQEMREKLIGTLAHGIRNPISTASLALDLLKKKNGEVQVNKLTEMAKKNLRRAIDLLEGLLDAISIKAGEGVTLDFSRDNIMREVHSVYEEAGTTYSNEVKLKAEQEKIEGVYDGTAVRRILENLLTNAMKYGAPDEPVTISVDKKDQEVTLSVHNHGNPISSKNQHVIFDFLRHDKPSSGELQSWGMGLAFVKMAAAAHGGHVELKSDQETGTTFSVVLDLSANNPGKVRSKINVQD